MKVTKKIHNIWEEYKMFQNIVPHDPIVGKYQYIYESPKGKISTVESYRAIQISSAKTIRDLSGRYPLPNLADIIAHLLENTTPPVRLSKKTLIKVFSLLKNKQAALNNPYEFATLAVRTLKEKLADFLVDRIQYEKINEWYEITKFQGSFQSWEDYVIPAERSIYDKVECDSEVERKLVQELKSIDQVLMYIKLPDWFTVPTPVGEYNPDWAIVWEDRDEHGRPTRKSLLYLIRETKSTTEKDKLRPDERRKLDCGKSHFDTLGVNYRVLTSATELP